MPTFRKPQTYVSNKQTPIFTTTHSTDLKKFKERHQLIINNPGRKTQIFYENICVFPRASAVKNPLRLR
jgi:hypothetical protein